jgi:glycosyltransferase involved in cell wall biosynthesis
MKVSVILCTYNRCQTLEKALESVAASEVPSSIGWEVLIVDNNSRDETRAMAEKFCLRYPGRFRYLFEGQAGKSYALNAGIQKAEGDVLAFMDDDVIVEKAWLQNLVAPILSGPWTGSGGRILPERAFVPPRWLSVEGRYALAPFALFNLGPLAEELTEAPFGTNMAFRKEMFLRHGNFRTDLGPRPGSEIRNEDTEFGSRLLAAGERFWYEPAAVVYHPVADSRVTQSYLLTWWFDKARADVRELAATQEAKSSIAGIPTYLFPRFAAWIVRWLVSINPARRFTCKIKVWSTAGTMAEYHRISKAREVKDANKS